MCHVLQIPVFNNTEQASSILEMHLIYRTALGLHSWMLCPAMLAALLQGDGLDTFPVAMGVGFCFSSCGSLLCGDRITCRGRGLMGADNGLR